MQPEVVALAAADGKPLDPFGSHSEVAISRKFTDKTRMQLAAYLGSIANTSIGGSGALQQADLAVDAILVDPSTATFRLTESGYADRGVSAMLLHHISPVLTASLAVDLGSALERRGVDAVTLQSIDSRLSAAMAPAASVALKGHVTATGTAVRAQYRWQPRRTLTQVNSYNVSDDDAYLSFYVRQRLRLRRLLPQGLDAVIAATNLLEEGYQPVVASDGHTLFLAQVPRSIEGGFSFTF